ncbi:MAG: NADH-quinone oxidoreductase subunit G, partial [Arcobacteraceae bacterium]
KFDDLENHFSNDRVEHRGYKIKTTQSSSEDRYISPDILTLEVNENEYIIYAGNPINQFNEFTASAKQLKDEIVALYVSETTKIKLDVEDDSKVEITANNTTIILDVIVDKDLVGDISYVPTFDKNINTKDLFKNRFEKANLRKV